MQASSGNGTPIYQTWITTRVDTNLLTARIIFIEWIIGSLFEESISS